MDKLRDTAVAGRERAERVDNDDVLMRRYMVYYKSRCENKVIRRGTQFALTHLRYMILLLHRAFHFDRTV